MAARRDRAEFDRDAERAADGRAHLLGARAGLLGAQHRREALLARPRACPAPPPISAEIAGTRPASSASAGREIERDLGPPGDVQRRHRGLPLLGGERRDGGHAVDRRPAQGHVQPVAVDLGRGQPGEHHEAAGRRVVKLGESLGEAHRGDLAVPAAAADPPQTGKRRAREDLINGSHRRSPYADRTHPWRSWCNLPITFRPGGCEHVCVFRLPARRDRATPPSGVLPRGSDGAPRPTRAGHRGRVESAGRRPRSGGPTRASSRSWYVWRGVAGLYYARIPGSARSGWSAR